MKRKQYSWIIALVFGLFSGPLQAAEKPLLLREGLELRQIEGTARIHPRTKAWRFVTHKTLRDRNQAIPTGTELTILPGSALEKIVAYAEQEEFVSLRLDAVVTRYQNSNFLFVFDATPLTETAPDQPPAAPADEPSPEQTEELLKTATDPNAPSIIPPDSLQRMKPRQKTDFARMEKAVEEINFVQDTMIVNRTGRFIRRDGALVFVLDGFGQNISGRSFALLPCQTLEQTEARIKRAFGRQRYRVSGIVTVFRGKPFLLLQGAVRTYTHGNFTP